MFLMFCHVFSCFLTDVPLVLMQETQVSGQASRSQDQKDTLNMPRGERPILRKALLIRENGESEVFSVSYLPAMHGAVYFHASHCLPPASQDNAERESTCPFLRLWRENLLRLIFSFRVMELVSCTCAREICSRPLPSSLIAIDLHQLCNSQ